SGRYERLRYAEGRVDVSHLAAGVYYLQIVTTTDVHREKIVVGY
ncbi:MAG: T9SS type A sorting domain-containing protein, partial [Bacteroidales bacterium]|nr:T9SS type A sorting domain-containing protein [Bacteroidales bacterium]